MEILTLYSAREAAGQHMQIGFIYPPSINKLALHVFAHSFLTTDLQFGPLL